MLERVWQLTVQANDFSHDEDWLSKDDRATSMMGLYNKGTKLVAEG